MNPKTVILTFFAIISLLARADMKVELGTPDGTVDIDSMPPVKGTLQLTPTGRLEIEAGGFISNNPDMVSGIGIPEARIGMLAEFEEFSSKIEVGFSYNKVTLKDVALMASFRPWFFLKVGYFLQPFGMQVVNATMRASMQRGRCSAAFDPGRHIGVMGVYHHNRWIFAGSVAAEPKAAIMTADKMGHTGVAIYSRLLYRPLREPGRIFHAGLSAGWVTPEYNSEEALNHKSFTITTHFPTSVDRVVAAEAVVTDARSMVKLSPEILAAFGRLGFESQYYYNRIFRRSGMDDFVGWGVYGRLRALVAGDASYRYVDSEGKLATPHPHTLELSADYNYTDLCSASVAGGRVSDMSLTLNWYINKYMVWRLRCGYTHAWASGSLMTTSLTSAETRFQFIF